MSGIPADVVIVGAGIVGSCTAYELARRGRRVVLIEQFDFGHACGSSHGESRIIRRTYPEPYYAAMMPTAYDLWHAAEVEFGQRVITTTGGLDFGSNSERLKRSSGGRPTQSINSGPKSVCRLSFGDCNGVGGDVLQ